MSDDSKITAIVSAAATIGVIAVLGAAVYGCSIHEGALKEQHMACVSAGGTFIKLQGDCLMLTPKPRP